jgi:hypothetical protein
MTIFEFNGLICDFIPRSLHFFERENYRTSSILGTPSNLCPHVILDPEGRMAAVRVFSSHLALIPFETSIEHNSTAEINSETSETNFLQSHVINFATQIDSRLKLVKNLIFLPGFLNPTVAILYDRGSNEGENDNSMPLRTELNHCNPSNPKETCAIMIVAIEPILKYRAARSDSSAFQFTVVNCIEGVPFDAEGLYALPKPVGGLFITCTNLLLWCDISSSTAPYSIALNQFAPLTYSGRISIAQFQGLNLSSLLDCRILALQPAIGNSLKCLFITKHGEKLLISISRTGRTLGFFNIERIENGARIAPSPSDLIQWDDDTIFVASEGGACQLISLYGKEGETFVDDKDIVNVNKDIKQEMKSKSKSKAEVSSSKTSAPLNDDIDAFLYGEDVEMTTAPPLKSAPIPDDDYLMSLEKEITKSVPVSSKLGSLKSRDNFKFELIDELDSLGPIVDLAVGSNDFDSTELVTVGGAFTSHENGTFYPGSLNVLIQKIPPSIQLSFNLPETRKIWTLNTFGNETKYLVASTLSSTLVLTTSQARIVELEESDFYLEGPTLFCSTFNEKLILQIYPTGMKLLNLKDASIFNEIRADFNGLIKVSCTEKSILILNSAGFLQEYSMNLKSNRSFKQVSTFTSKNEKIYISFLDGSFSIYWQNEIIFENSFFSRLPVTLTNRPVVETNAKIEISQKIISLDVIEGDGDVLVVRYEAQRSIGIVSYRLNGGKLLQRITSEPLILSSPSSNVVPDSLTISNELILSFNTANSDSFPIYSFALNSRSYPRLHLLLPNDSSSSSSSSSSPEETKIISLASYNQTSLMVLMDNGNVSIIDLQKMRRKFNLNWQSGWYLKRLALDDDKEEDEAGEKIKILRIPTHVTFHPPSKTYLVASAEISSDFTLPSDEYAPISDNQNAQSYNGPVPKLFGVTSNSLHLINPISWTCVDSVTESFLPYEGVTCIRCLELETRQTATGFSPFLTVGTAYQKGEDRPIRGRALVFDVAEVVPEPGKPETNRKLRLKGISEFKGPVMSFTPLLLGNVAISAGAKVIVNTFEEDEKFAGVAFSDVGTCTLALASLKSFFITADLVNSVAFFAFQAEPLARIHELGRDFGQNLQCTAVEFVVNSQGQTMIVVSDDQGGLHFFSYAPNSILISYNFSFKLIISFNLLDLTTNSGQRLLDKGSFNLHGSPVTKLFRIPSSEDDLGVLVASQDGSLNLITPIPDVSMFRRLFMLEIRLGTVLPSSGGLVTRVARQVPRRMTVTHALPATASQYTVTLPTSAIRIASEDQENTTISNDPSSLNSTLILHHLPVSNSIIDAQAIKRLHSDPLCDGLARQIFANRFGINFENLMTDVTKIYSKFYL